VQGGQVSTAQGGSRQRERRDWEVVQWGCGGGDIVGDSMVGKGGVKMIDGADLSEMMLTYPNSTGS
jgi:2-polyprenyl-3-methyl-5-hydroxy-6-metoxy-1,4-benzoquinol methylase